MQPGGYLTGQECLDVCRMTGIPMSARSRLGQQPDTYPGAVEQGVIGFDEVLIDLHRLSHEDASRVMWSRIAAHEWLRTEREGVTRETWTDNNIVRKRARRASNRTSGVVVDTVADPGRA